MTPRRGRHALDISARRCVNRSSPSLKSSVKFRTSAFRILLVPRGSVVHQGVERPISEWRLRPPRPCDINVDHPGRRGRRTESSGAPLHQSILEQNPPSPILSKIPILGSSLGRIESHDPRHPWADTGALFERPTARVPGDAPPSAEPSLDNMWAALLLVNCFLPFPQTRS